MKKENKNVSKGLIGTIVFHGILLGLFLIFGFTPAPVEFPDDIGGILIDFGDSDQGLGEIEPESNNVSQAVNNQSEDNTEEYITQDYQETATIDNNQENNNQNTEEETEISLSDAGIS